MASFAGGVAQAGYVARVRDLVPQRCLVVPVDVGRRTAMALVGDHYGQVIVEPFEFGLTMSGVDNSSPPSPMHARGWARRACG